MSLGKELLLSCIVMMMHISFMASQSIAPFETTELRNNMKGIELSLCNLKMAEKNYTWHMFKGQPPNGYESKRLEGITWPVGNTVKEIQTFICVITGYLDKLMHEILRPKDEEQQKIINETRAFTREFKAASHGIQKQCHVNVTFSHDYAKRETGLLIFYFARQWMENFANISTVCEDSGLH